MLNELAGIRKVSDESLGRDETPRRASHENLKFSPVFESKTKMESSWSFSLHCLQPISLKFSNVKKEQIFAAFLLEEVCFHGI